jgi:hypothetical protein
MTTRLDCTMVLKKKFFIYWNVKFKGQRERKKVEEIF